CGANHGLLEGPDFAGWTATTSTVPTTSEPQQAQRREEPEQELALADLDLPGESAGDLAGRTRGGGCEDEFGCGTNHNEVLAGSGAAVHDAVDRVSLSFERVV